MTNTRALTLSVLAAVQLALALACGTSSSTDSGAADAGARDASVEDARPDAAAPDAQDPDAGAPDAEDRFAALTAAIEAERIAAGAFGASFAVVEDGAVVYARGFGSKGRTGNVPVLPTTLFHIGSMTKTFTAVGLLKLVDSGQVELDAPITRYVPEFTLTASAALAATITIEQLLTHGSGFPDELVSWAQWPSTADSELERYLTSAQFQGTHGLIARPGRMWIYSNIGIDLAGMVIQRVSGRPFPDYMRDEVFVPLGMTRTTFRRAEVIADGDFAYGQVPPGNYDIAPDTFGDIPWQRPCGLAFSSVIDLAEWTKFVMNGNAAVLSPGLHADMIAPQRTMDVHGDRASWGLGFIVADGVWSKRGLIEHELRSVTHGGIIRGNTSNFTTIPSRNLAVISLTNIQGLFFDDSVSVALELAGIPAREPAVPGDDPANLPRYAGAYDAPGVGRVDVTVEGTGLRIRGPTGSGVDCLAHARTPRNYRCDGEEPFFMFDTYTFLVGEDDDVELLRAAGQAWVGTRAP